MLTRRALVVVGSAVVVMAGAVPALADNRWGNVDCAQNPHPGCELGVGKGREHRGGPPEPESRLGRPGPGGEDDGPRERKPPRHANPDWNRATCSYKRSGYRPPTAQQAALVRPSVPGAERVLPADYVPEPSASTALALPAAEPGDGDGAWYVYKCAQDGVRDAFYRPPVWIPDREGDEPDEPEVSPASLAQRAREQLRLPDVGIKTSPSDRQLVHLPTWLWLERGSWKTVKASASVPGVSVTATARPTKARWRMGDGHTVTCTGPGTPYRPGGRPGRASPSCGHTYRASSAGQPDRAFPVKVTVHWSVRWSGAGESGTFPGLTTSASSEFRVAESQAVNNSGR